MLIDAQLVNFFMRFVFLRLFLLERWMSADIRFPDYIRLAPGTGLCLGGYYLILYSQNDNPTPCLLHPSSEPTDVNAYTLALPLS
jgi:hypothetical protein